MNFFLKELIKKSKLLEKYFISFVLLKMHCNFKLVFFVKFSDHSYSTYAKFSEKLLFVPGGKKYYFFGKFFVRAK